MILCNICTKSTMIIILDLVSSFCRRFDLSVFPCAHLKLHPIDQHLVHFVNLIFLKDD